LEIGSPELPIGTPFASRSGLRTGIVGALLGSGGQGACYEAQVDGGRFALKWYHDHYAEIDSGLYTRLAKAVERGAPDTRFLWPLELVQSPGRRSFGYLMPLRDPAYIGMRELLAPPPKRVELSLAQRATVCAHIAHCFLELHARGFCYQDVNFGNIFLNPATADVLICDNDNVNIDGADASIYGTRKFMAPEIVRRECLPSTKTDLFSMAVMFFYVLFGWHPLDGRREAETRILDANAENRLYGTQPLFIFDPNDDANGPLAPMHDALVYRWRSLPEDLRGLLLRSFTSGLHSPGARVHEYEWQKAFAAVRDKAFACDQCGYENVVDQVDRASPTAGSCAYCEETLAAPPVLMLGGRAVVLEDGLELSSDRLFGDSEPLATATVIAHPDRPGTLGLRNLGATTWRAEVPGYSATPIGTGKTIRLLHGLRLDFGRAVADVVNLRDSGD
jgi:DNA-binding helix-hairpin-helix protein with protein kinase domain